MLPVNDLQSIGSFLSVDSIYSRPTSTFSVIGKLSIFVMSWCSIPGCNYSRKSKDSKRAIFRIFRPALGKKSVEARKHYETLSNFLLQLRDFQKGDKIKELLHKETACICESHFNDDDMIVNKAKKQLKLGAIPSRNLPRNVKEIKVCKQICALLNRFTSVIFFFILFY